ncbi:MAG: hypothetical protein IPP72_18465 [Chitinophagaceae bacterium]|nr:hypothetical protein [Chitinophagaceae bacterium]
MKLICSFMLLVFAAGSAFAQTNPDEVISKIIDAQGGKDKLLTIQSVKMTGNIEFSGQKFLLIITLLTKPPSVLSFLSAD